jgi:CitB family two-component system response regulator MalR
LHTELFFKMDKVYRFKRALVIDDTDIDRVITEKILKLYGFAEQVISVNSAQKGLEYLAAEMDGGNLPDLIFLDLNMPVMNGFDFLDAYTHMPEHVKRKNIIVLTSSLDDNDRSKSLSSAYVLKFVSKPLTEGVLKQIEG